MTPSCRLLLTAAQRRLPALQRFCWKSRTKCDAVVTFIAQRSVSNMPVAVNPNQVTEDASSKESNR
jgi:hypothetical protein